ncbi:MAG: rRNA pseudouridine synthase [Deltaproteobacteria bacterium]|jgi:pseudouridine synthase|nr:rRNA pseudouridine synthase [Deltaproteobacteria bacterium]
MQAERLQKILSKAGITSRRKAEGLILQGRVSVNGKIVRELGTKAVLGRDEIRVDGETLKPESEGVVLVLFKPRRCVTTLHDPQGRPTVADFVNKFPMRLYPVGRLDYDAEGLLLLTNDGELAHRLQHPRYKVPKTYLVKVRGHPPAEALAILQQGVNLEDGITAPAELIVIEDDQKATWLSLTLREGRKHQVKRMCAAVGHPVLRLRRTKVGPIELDDLRPGEIRRLKSRAVRSLRKNVGLK